MSDGKIRDFSKVGDAVEVPDLIELQRRSYERFLQSETEPAGWRNFGLEALFREIFPIDSYDKKMRLEYLCYELERPRYSVQECRDLRLTYGYPLKVRCRLHTEGVQEITEQSIYLGEIPVMIGGGEFIINGAERVIVSQLHRSPGVDFLIESKEGDRVLHGGRIIPERGSWIELNVSRRDVLAVRIDQSSRIPATTFLRAMTAEYNTTEQIIRLFYTTKTVTAANLEPTMWVVGPIVDTETGEIILKAGTQIGDRAPLIRDSKIKTVEILENVRDLIILNTLAEDDCESHEQARLKIYQRLRPGNPPNLEKAKTLFTEKFFDTNRYRLGRVGRFRLNRKFGQNVDKDEMTLRPEDLLNTLKYIVGLRNGEGEIDDIDHLGNRRLRTIDELASDEIRKGLLKLRRTVQERMSMKKELEPGQPGPRIADLVNSKSVSSSVDYFFGRGELSQVVDQTNALSQLTHERRLSALGPGGLNRKRAGFEVRDVHISHYGRICPIETPEGTNIGLIASLGIFATVDEYGFLLTPYRKVKNGKVTDEVVQMRADEEMRVTFAPAGAANEKGRFDGIVLGRKHGDLAQVYAEEIDYVDISPKQIVGVTAALIPFLEHDDANRALMGSNMQRQAVPLLTTEPPLVVTGMEKYVAQNSSMVVRAKSAGVVTAIDASGIVINHTDEYPLQKFVGLNERTCLNQKPIVKLGKEVKKDQIIADGGGTSNGVLALGKNLLVAFVPFDGYNFEDAIIISEKLVRNDTLTSIHIDEFTAEVRETKLGREEFTRDIPNVGERALRNLDEHGIVREGTRVCGPEDILVGKVSPKSKTELTPEEKLLHAIFGRAGEDVKNDSLTLPSGCEGFVIQTKHFKRRGGGTEEEHKALRQELQQCESEFRAKECAVFRQMMAVVHEKGECSCKMDKVKADASATEAITEWMTANVENVYIPFVFGDEQKKLVSEGLSYLQSQLKIKDDRKDLKETERLFSFIEDRFIVEYPDPLNPVGPAPYFNRRLPKDNKQTILKVWEKAPEKLQNWMKEALEYVSTTKDWDTIRIPQKEVSGIYLFRKQRVAAALSRLNSVIYVGTSLDLKERLDAHWKGNVKASMFRWHIWQELVCPERKPDVTIVDPSTRQKVGVSDNDEVIYEQIENFDIAWVKPAAQRPEVQKVLDKYRPKLTEIQEEKNRRLERFKRGDELPSGVLEMVKVYVATKRSLSVGDKIAGRHGNKGVIARIMPVEDMPFLEDGTPADILLNPLGVPSRMNVGQILETHLGWAAKVLGFDAVTPVFDGATEEEIHKLIAEANEHVLKRKEYIEQNKQIPLQEELFVQIPPTLKARLYDGRTGEPFEQEVTIGYLYMMKLHHLVDDKIHARATGPYSLITQQPLGGKARTGGQRFGEMEVWALEAYGAAYTLQELLTVKSDDIEGRTKIYESIVKGQNTLEAGTPISFDVLCNEIRGLGLNIQLEKKRLGGTVPRV
jgi:DNA-directed RNA polymerase subunit beta